MERLTQYMGIVHLGGAFEVSTTRIQVHLPIISMVINVCLSLNLIKVTYQCPYCNYDQRQAKQL